MTSWSDDEERRWSREHIGFPHARGTCRQCDEDRVRFHLLDKERPVARMGPAAAPRASTAILRLLVTALVLTITVSAFLIAWAAIVGS